MKTLQGQLRAARQQGMPAWLLDVQSHNILESHLSKGYAQPAVPEGDEELVGVAGLVQDGPTGPTGPAQGNPDYALLNCLEHHEVEELEQLLAKY